MKGNREDFDEITLPALREDLQLVARVGAKEEYVVYDPKRHSYLKIGKRAATILSVWQVGAIDGLQAKLPIDFDLQRAELSILLNFLHANGLFAEAPKRSNLGTKKNFPFYQRLSLGDPELILVWLHQHLKFVFHPLFWLAGTVFFIACLWLLNRRGMFDASSLTHLPMLELWVFFLLWGCSKLLHELGHGLAAKHFVCRVSDYGVLFVFGLPLFYCDVSDAWRLAQKKERLVIDLAGIAAEWLFACFLFLFALLFLSSEAQQAVVLMVSAMLAWTLIVNLNPLLRFDGYYALTDMTGFDNLQTRASMLLRYVCWKTFDPERARKHGALERYTDRQAAFLLTYAGAVIVFRALVFIAIISFFAFWLWSPIAVLLSALAFYFLYLRSFLLWLKGAKWQQAATAIGLIVTCGFAFFYPWIDRFSASAILIPAQISKYVSHGNGDLLTSAQHGDFVRSGQLLFEDIGLELEYRHRRASIELQLAEARLRKIEFDAESSELLSTVLADTVLARRKLEATTDQIKKRSGRATNSGYVVGMPYAVGSRLRLQKRKRSLRLLILNLSV